MNDGGGVNGRVSSGDSLCGLCRTRRTLGGVGHGGRDLADLAQVVDECGPDQLAFGRRRLGDVGVAVTIGSGLQVHPAGQQVRRGDTVGQGVVDLAEHGDAPVGQTLDQVHLPQRPAAVQRRAGDPADRLVELASTARSLDAIGADVVLQVDFGVLPPHRMVELERNVDQFPAERIELVEPAVDDLAQLLDTEGGPTEVVEFDDRQFQRVHVRSAFRCTAAQRPSRGASSRQHLLLGEASI